MYGEPSADLDVSNPNGGSVSSRWNNAVCFRYSALVLVLR